MGSAAAVGVQAGVQECTAHDLELAFGDLSDGARQKLLHALQDTTGPNDAGHPLRGVSVEYLATTFLSEVQGTGMTRNARVYEVEPDVIRGKGETALCPRDGRPGAAYVDCVLDGHAGASTVMLSYTWGYAVGDIADGLENFCKTGGLQEADTNVWICCLCINQHRVIEATKAGLTVPFEEFHEALRSRVCGIGHICALMMPWRKPMYLTRVWCVFEIYTALTQGCRVTVTMPQEQSDSMLATLLKADFGATALDEIFKALAAVKVEDALASVEADRTNILGLIESGPGCASIDKRVSEFLRDWVFDVCDESLMQKRRAAHGPKHDIAKLCFAFGEVLAQFNHFERARDVLQESKHIREELCVLETKNVSDIDGTQRCCSGAIVLSYLGMAKLKAEDLQGARADMESSERIFKQHDVLESMDGGLLMCHLGALETKEGNHEKARLHYEEALRIHTASKTLVSWPGAFLFINLGLHDVEQGRLADALQHLRKSKQIYENLGTLMWSPNAAMCVSVLGGILLLQGNVEEARPELELAVRIRAATGSLETEGGADCRQHLGMLKYSTGDPVGALADLQAAKQIYTEQKVPVTGKFEVFLVNLAAVHLQAQDFAALVAEFEDVREMFFAVGTPHTHQTGALLNLVGMAKNEIGNSEGAIADLHLAESFYAACHMKRTVEYAAVLINLASSRMKSKDGLAAARTELEQAKGIFEAVGQMADPRAAMLLQLIAELDGSGASVSTG